MKNAAKKTKSLTVLEVVILLQKGRTGRPFQFDFIHRNELVD